MRGGLARASAQTLNRSAAGLMEPDRVNRKFARRKPARDDKQCARRVMGETPTLPFSRISGRSAASASVSPHSGRSLLSSMKLSRRILTAALCLSTLAGGLAAAETKAAEIVAALPNIPEAKFNFADFGGV